MNAVNSRYNLITKTDEEYIVYNSLYSTFAVIDEKGYSILTNSERDKNPQAESIVNSLCELGMLTYKPEEEENKAIIKYMKTINDDSVLRIIILPTMQCNFRCKYCYENYENGIMGKDIQDNIIKYVKNNISGHKYLRITWFGGEPTLCIDIIEYINKKCWEIARFYHVKFMSDITTNGFLLTLENFNRLTKCHVTDFQITIDGNKENHDYLRPTISEQPTYDTILNNLLLIRDKKKSCLFNILIRINFTQTMIDDFSNIVTYLSQKFANDDRFGFSFFEVGDMGGSKINEIKEELIKSRDSLADKLLQYDGEIKLRGLFNRFDRYPLCYASYPSCFIVNPKGVINKCTVEFNKNYNNIGDLQSDGYIKYNEFKLKWDFLIFQVLNNTRCKQCACFASCFGSICPKQIVELGHPVYGICNTFEKWLQAYYKFNKNVFRVVK